MAAMLIIMLEPWTTNAGTTASVSHFSTATFSAINGTNPRDKSRLLSRPKGRGMNPKGFNLIHVSDVE
jgi:hypothetical protein